MNKKRFAIAAVVVVAAAVVTGMLLAPLTHDHDSFHMAWKDTFETPRAMIRNVDAIVVARMIGTSPGRVAFSTSPEDAVPFELNHFQVERSFVDGISSGAALTVERIGGAVDDERIVLDADGGAYIPGESYVLFLNRQEESDFFYLVNDEGRYGVTPDERLVTDRDGAVAMALNGETLGGLASLVDRARSDRPAGAIAR